jgi:hypothetical protein
MIGGSFRLSARISLLLALVVILSACGGSTPKQQVSTRIVHGPGLTFAVPAGWAVHRTAAAVVAKRGKSSVSATVFTLLKPYDPARFPAAAKELDGVAAKLAGEAGGAITEQVTTRVDGRRIRAYRFASKGAHMRIGFVLVGKREVQLLCDAPGSTDTDGACALLFATFRMG